MISANHDFSRLFSLHPARQLIAVGRSSVDLPLPAVFGLIADTIQKKYDTRFGNKRRVPFLKKKQKNCFGELSSGTCQSPQQIRVFLFLFLQKKKYCLA
jgi:hypothetical protein